MTNDITDGTTYFPLGLFFPNLHHQRQHWPLGKKIFIWTKRQLRVCLYFAFQINENYTIYELLSKKYNSMLILSELRILDTSLYLD